MRISRYSEYRDTGLRWLGVVPGHWEVRRLRFAATLNPSKAEIAGLDRDLEVSFLPMDAIGDDGTLKLEQTRSISDVESGYTFFRDGDVVIAKITPCFENGKGALMEGLARGIGFGTTELIVVRPTPERLNSSFLGWLFRTPNFRSEGRGAMYGAGGQKRVPDDFVRNFAWALPPISEQCAIADFLDRETAKIDALIAEQERLLALLAEKRQAVISHAVTKGLDPDVPMKDSGAVWLGDIPKHWGVVPLKYVVDLRSGGTPSKDRLDYWDGHIPWASARDLKVDELIETALNISQKAIDDGAANLVPSGAVLVVVRGMILARTFPVAETRVPMAINQDLKALIPRESLDPSFLAWLLRGSAEESLQRLDEAGHGTKALRMNAWTSIQLPLPPKEEQVEIADYIRSKTADIDALSLRVRRSIELLEERRSALIAAAVSGQIEVSEAA